MNESIDIPESTEQEQQPKLRLMFTRHTERLPNGTLSPEGQAHARRKGEGVRESGAEVLKAYVSDHKSGRAVETGETVTSASGIESPHSGKQYRTHKVPDIQYDILKPDLSKIVAKAKDMIDTATLQELGMSTERDEKGKLKIDLESLPVDEQARIAPIRAKHQRVGLNFVMQNEAAVERMAFGLAHQLAHELALSKRYMEMRDRAKKPPKGDVVLNTVGHGMFSESLLRKAGVRLLPNGSRQEITDFESADFGGLIAPGESWTLVIDDPLNVPKDIPVEFEGPGRPNGQIFIDRDKLLALDKRYEAWKAQQK